MCPWLGEESAVVVEDRDNHLLASLHSLAQQFHQIHLLRTQIIFTEFRNVGSLRVLLFFFVRLALVFVCLMSCSVPVSIFDSPVQLPQPPFLETFRMDQEPHFLAFHSENQVYPKDKHLVTSIHKLLLENGPIFLGFVRNFTFRNLAGPKILKSDKLRAT